MNLSDLNVKKHMIDASVDFLILPVLYPSPPLFNWHWQETIFAFLVQFDNNLTPIIIAFYLIKKNIWCIQLSMFSPLYRYEIN